MSGTWGLPFLAVGRVKDSVTLASYANIELDPNAQTAEIFKKLLAAAASKLTPGQRTRLQWNDGSVCCLMDTAGENLYCVVTSVLAYPERLAYQLLYDLVAVASQEQGMASVGEHGLQKEFEQKMREMVRYYEDPNNFPQWAMGAAGSEARASLSTSPSWQPATPEGGGRTKLYIGIAVVVLLIIAVVLYFQFTSTAVSEVAAAAPAGFLTARVVDGVEGARVGSVAKF